MELGQLIEYTWDSRNYMLPILLPSSAKRIATQSLVIGKFNGRKNFIFRVFVCDIIRPSKEFEFSKLVPEAQE